MKTNRKLFLMMIIIVVVTGLLTVSVTMAVWSQNLNDSIRIDTPIVDENPSLKYQMFIPMKLSGTETPTQTESKYTRMSGTYSIVNNVYTYTLDLSERRDDIVGYALVGWFGGVALEYIEIPDSVTMSFGGVEVTKPVVRIMAARDYTDYLLKGNKVIEKLIIGTNVTEVDRGVCLGMTALNTLIYKAGISEIYVREYAFNGCTKLTSIDNQRPVATGWKTDTIYDNVIIM